eukprot:scaffold40685_cov52-Attheya_sp.AAC.2
MLDGRDAGTYIPKTWGVLGASLVLPINLAVKSDSCKARDDWASRACGGLLVLQPLEEARFINERGEQWVLDVIEGGWKISFPS